MTKFITHGLAFKSTLASLLFFFSSSVWAGRPSLTLTYGPATPVPTLSDMMLIVLALLLAAITYRILRQKENTAGRMMVLSLLAVGTLASGVGGVKLINDAYAPPFDEKELTDPNGGVVIVGPSGTTRFINYTDGTTSILGIELAPECDVVDNESFTPYCKVGLKLADEASCFTSVSC